MVPILLALLAAGCGPPPPMEFLQEIESPDGSRVFALFEDSVWDSISWHVFAFDAGTDPAAITVPGAWEDDPDLAARSVTWNRAGSGADLDDPHIELIDDTYLVMVRGGLYHGVYNVRTDTTLFDDIRSWDSWVDAEQRAGRGRALPGSRLQYNEEFHAWKEANIHATITAIVEGGRGRADVELDHTEMVACLADLISSWEADAESNAEEMGGTSKMTVAIQGDPGFGRLADARHQRGRMQVTVKYAFDIDGHTGSTKVTVTFVTGAGSLIVTEQPAVGWSAPMDDAEAHGIAGSLGEKLTVFVRESLHKGDVLQPPPAPRTQAPPSSPKQGAD